MLYPLLVAKDRTDELNVGTASALPTPLPIVHPNGDAIAPRSRTPRFTPDQLRDFDDIATDVLINSVRLFSMSK